MSCDTCNNSELIWQYRRIRSKLETVIPKPCRGALLSCPVLSCRLETFRTVVVRSKERKQTNRRTANRFRQRDSAESLVSLDHSRRTSFACTIGNSLTHQ